MPYCSRCGTELPVGTKFCTNCGAPATAPRPLDRLYRLKPSHTKRNLAIIVILVILIGIVAASSSRAPSQNVTTQTTVRELQNGGTVRIGQPFILKGTDQVPVQLNFTSAWFAMWHGYSGATRPYKLFVLQFQMKNVGIRTTSVFSDLSKWDVLVDKGYIYGSELNFNFTAGVSPEQSVTNDVVFSIIATTTPTEVRYYDSCSGSTADCSPTFTVDLHGVNIPAKEELTIRGTNVLGCFFTQGKPNLLNVTNTGLIPVTIAAVYYADQIVTSNPTLVQPGETVSIPITIPSNIRPGSGIYGEQYDIKVVTTQGNTFTSNCHYRGP